MDINNLQAFIEVAEKRSFSRSAETLNLTQPAVSKRIASLESELASRLFDRVGRRVHLTEAGKVLLPVALKINSEVVRIQCELSTLGKEVGGRLSIGVAEHVGLDRLSHLLQGYKTRHANVSIDLQFLKSDEALGKVDAGQLDMALYAVSDLNTINKKHSRLKNLEVWNETLRVVAAKGHPLISADVVSVEQLARYPGILAQKPSAIRKSIDQLMSANGVEANVAMEASDFATAKSMASIGLGWVCLPKSQTDDTLLPIALSGIDLNYSIALIRSQDRSLSRAAQAFLELLPTTVI